MPGPVPSCREVRQSHEKQIGCSTTRPAFHANRCDYPNRRQDGWQNTMGWRDDSGLRLIIWTPDHRSVSRHWRGISKTHSLSVTLLPKDRTLLSSRRFQMVQPFCLTVKSWARRPSADFPLLPVRRPSRLRRKDTRLKSCPCLFPTAVISSEPLHSCR